MTIGYEAKNELSEAEECEEKSMAANVTMQIDAARPIGSPY